jgi:hypothetical protein
MVVRVVRKVLRAALHLKAGSIPLEADGMKFQPFLGWRPASTTHYNKIITGVNFSICESFRAKKLGRFNKSSIIQRSASASGIHNELKQTRWKINRSGQIVNFRSQGHYPGAQVPRPRPRVARAFAGPVLNWLFWYTLARCPALHGNAAGQRGRGLAARCPALHGNAGGERGQGLAWVS